MRWSIVYESAERDGIYPFESIGLTKEFLEQAKRTQGPYIYANQYLNEVIPEGLQTFKKEWLKTYKELPQNILTFAMIDPAIGMTDDSDYTATVVVSIDLEANWYVRLAKRERKDPIQIVNSLFELQKVFKCHVIGIEEVAYQKALLYLVDEEMRRRDEILPVLGLKPTNDETKVMRIRSLVPRYYWGRVFHNQGLDELELEMMQFPRGKHDDIIDALAYIDKMASAPTKEAIKDERPSNNSPDYEKWYIRHVLGKSQG